MTVKLIALVFVGLAMLAASSMRAVGDPAKAPKDLVAVFGEDGKRIEIDPAGSQRGSASIWRIKSA